MAAETSPYRSQHSSNLERRLRKKNTMRNDTQRSSLHIITFVVLAYSISWLLWSLLFLPHFNDRYSVWVIAAGGFGLFLAALLVVGYSEGRSGLGVWLRSLLKWRVHIGWYAVALLLPLIVDFAAFGFYHSQSFFAQGQPAHASGWRMYSSYNPDLSPPSSCIRITVFCLGWSRFYLSRHTLSEIITRGVLGFSCFASWTLIFGNLS